MTALDSLRAVMKGPNFKTSSDAFAQAIQLIKELDEKELVACQKDLKKFAKAQVNTSVSVEILKGVIDALVKDKKSTPQAGNSSPVPSTNTSNLVQTLNIGGESFKVRKGAQLPVCRGNQNKFNAEYCGTYTIRGGGNVFHNEKIRHFLTIHYGIGIQVVGLAKSPPDASSDLVYFALTSFQTTDAIWAAMFTEFQAAIGGSGEIELPPRFYNKLVKAGKIV